jgi:phage gp46-like protein
MSVGKTTDAVLFKDSSGIYDFQLDQTGDIKTEDFFDTSILMSIFCERRASVNEMTVSQYRRGWIGNESTPNFEIGSKLWLFEQSRLTRNTLNGINSVVKESLNWMIDDGIALEISVVSELNQNNRIVIEVTLLRPNSQVEKRYFDLWENTGK